MILRGISARRLLSFTVFVLTLVVVSGTVVTVAFSRLSHVSRASAGALVLLGFVAIASQAAESVRRREHELALARLRGRRGLRFLVFAVAEPGVVVLAGALAGVATGWFLTRLAVGAWLPTGSAVVLDRGVWLSAGMVTAGTLALVVGAGWRVASAPLQVQLSGARRPRTASTLGLFLQAVVVIGAAVAVYQANQASAARVDWVTLVSPAVVGLAAGQIVVWVVLAVLAVAVPRGGDEGFGWFITVRRLLRRADSLDVVRTVVAAGVVFGVAASASAAAQSWRVERAKLQTGAPVSYAVPAGALPAYTATQAADPHGRWLAAVAAYTTDVTPAARRVFVDTTRWATVTGSFFAGTAVAPLAAEVSSLRSPSTFPFVRGGSLTVTATTSWVGRGSYARIAVDYVDDKGDLVVRGLPLGRALAGVASSGVQRFSSPLHECQLGCVPTGIDISGRTRGDELGLLDVSFAGRHLLAPGSGLILVQTRGQIRSVRGARGLKVFLGRGDYGFGADGTLATSLPTESQRAVSTPGVGYDRVGGRLTVLGVDGSQRPVSVATTLPVLPFVGTRGSLLDLGSVLVGARGSIPGTDAVILARADTPATVIAALRATGVTGRPTTYATALTRLEQTPRAEGTRLYLLVALFAGLVALVSSASAVLQQIGQRRQEAASLRTAGLRVPEIAAAYRREAVLLAVATLLGTSVAAWSASRVLLPALPLVSGWAFAPPLEAAPRPVLLGLTALIAGAVVGLVTYVAFRRLAGSSPPRVLREDET